MGQYYNPAILDTNNKSKVVAWAYSHDYKSGLKLMEHSWIGNNFVERIEKEIFANPKRIVWAGDYAEPDVNEDGKFIHVHVENGKEHGQNIYNLCTDDLKLPLKNPHRIARTKFIYLVNHDKKEFVNISTKKLPVSDIYTDGNGKKHYYRVHPLPLLTSEGNGGGGGDYFSSNGKEYIGTWARDLISLESVVPEGFTEIKPNFKE
jgi:hypothetical protein